MTVFIRPLAAIEEAAAFVLDPIIPDDLAADRSVQPLLLIFGKLTFFNDAVKCGVFGFFGAAAGKLTVFTGFSAFIASHAVASYFAGTTEITSECFGPRRAPDEYKATTLSAM